MCHCVEENGGAAAAPNGIQYARRVSRSRVAPEEENQPGSANSTYLPPPIRAVHVTGHKMAKIEQIRSVQFVHDSAKIWEQNECKKANVGIICGMAVGVEK